MDKSKYKINKHNTYLRNELYNYNFFDAVVHLAGESKEVKSMVKILSNMFGNVDTIGGEMEALISYILILMDIKFKE